MDGPAASELELVMYGDFQCPYTAAAVPIVTRVRSRFASRLLYGFRHFPLRDIHPDAERAAEASEAAGVQGGFWPMYDAIFGSSGSLSREELVGHATELGLDAERFAAELDSAAHAGRVQRDVDSGKASGVKGTPAFFVNGRLHDGPFDEDTLTSALEA